LTSITCEERSRIEAHALGEDEALRERRPVDAKYEVDRQFRAAAVARRAQMAPAGTDCIEDLARSADRSLLSTDQPQRVALHSLLAGARNGRLDVAQSICRQPCRQRGDAVGVAGAYAYRDEGWRAGRKRSEQALTAFDDLFDLVRIEYGQDDAATRGCDFRDRASGPGAGLY
jgi:hypothetical protein